eukprot:24749-Rhodomonas_salina.1
MNNRSKDPTIQTPSFQLLQALACAEERSWTEPRRVQLGTELSLKPLSTRKPLLHAKVLPFLGMHAANSSGCLLSHYCRHAQNAFQSEAIRKQRCQQSQQTAECQLHDCCMHTLVIYTTMNSEQGQVGRRLRERISTLSPDLNPTCPLAALPHHLQPAS